MKTKLKTDQRVGHRKGWSIAAVMLLWIAVGIAPSFAASLGARQDDGATNRVHAKLAADLHSRNSNAMIDVIVQFRQKPQASHYSRMSARGAFVKTKLHGIRAAAFRIPVSALPALEADPDILYVTPDRAVQLTNSDENYESAVQADIAASQYALDGTGVGVALIDSGVSDHLDLHNASGASRVVYSQSFVAGDTSTVDAYGHGTHVAGIVAGNGTKSGSGSGYSVKHAGMAPGANLINLRVLDANGSGS